MTLSVKVNGIDYHFVKSARVSATVSAVTRSFSITSSADKANTFPIKVNDKVQIDADGVTVLDGFIERLNVSYSADAHQINVSGRSIMADLVDSTVPTQLEITGTTLSVIAGTVLDALGIDHEIINKAGEIKPFEDITSAEIGANAFDFLEAYSRKRQVLLTTDGLNGLVFMRSGTTKAPAQLVNKLNNDNNNIKSGNIIIDNSERYNKYSVRSQLNPLLVGLSPKTVSDQNGIVTDDEIRSTRKYEFNAEESMDSETSYDRALWEKNIRVAKSLNYSCTIQGHSVNGVLWEPNTLALVKDDFAQVNAELLITGVDYYYSLTEGSTTLLYLTNKKAFTLELAEAAREDTQQTGGPLIG